MPRSKEPFVWALFSSGGMLAALFLPAAVLVLWVAGPLGWTDAAVYESFAKLVRQPVGRLFLLALITLSLFHWAHRFRFTLYDGLQLSHLRELIAVLTYGTAIVLSLATALTLLILL